MSNDKIMIYGFDFDVSKVFEYMDRRILDDLSPQQRNAIKEAVISTLKYYKSLEEERLSND